MPAHVPGCRSKRVVAVMAVDGSNEKLLTKPRPMSTAEQLAPVDWSADELRKFQCLSNRRSVSAWRMLFSLNTVTPPEEPASVRMIHRDLVTGCMSAVLAGWSLDIIQRRDLTGTSTIYTVPTSGGEWTPITDTRFWDDKPRWAPDGRTIYFISRRAGFINIWGRRFDSQVGAPVSDPFQVTDFGTPSRMVLPHISGLHIALFINSHNAVTDVRASIWVLARQSVEYDFWIRDRNPGVQESSERFTYRQRPAPSNRSVRSIAIIARLGRLYEV